MHLYTDGDGFWSYCGEAFVPSPKLVSTKKVKSYRVDSETVFDGHESLVHAKQVWFIVLIQMAAWDDDGNKIEERLPLTYESEGLAEQAVANMVQNEQQVIDEARPKKKVRKKK